MTTKLHEVLAAEDTVTKAADKLIAETTDKFGRHGEFFVGMIRTLKRVNSSPEDEAREASERREKVLPTNVPETVDYTMGFVTKMLDTKLQKHVANQKAKASIIIDGQIIMSDAPVDFLLDLEKAIPRWKEMFNRMPTLDPSKNWIEERKHVFKTKDAIASAQTEKQLYPVVLSPATDKHAAQVKESSRDVVVGTYNDLFFSGAVTTQKKADIYALCDKLMVSVKEARMRANTADAPRPVVSASTITGMFTDILGK